MTRHLLTPLLPLLMLAACSDDAPNEPTPIQRTEIATITRLERPVIFELPGDDGTPAVTLSADVELQGATAGQRVLLLYSMAVADTALNPRPITIRGVGGIPWGEIKPLQPEVIGLLEMKHYKILSSWTTGEWLNLQMEYRTGGETVFTLVADSATIDDEEVRCHFIAVGNPEGNAYVDRRTFASFSTSKILTRPGQKVVIAPPSEE